MLLVLSTTSPTLALNPNPKRTRLLIQMQALDVDSNNTGRIHVDYGQQPNTTVASVSQGDILIAGASIAVPAAGEKIAKKYQQAVWFTSSVATQSIVIEEETAE